MRKLTLIIIAFLLCFTASAALIYNYKAPAYYMDQVIAAINSNDLDLEQTELAFEYLEEARTLVNDKELIIQRAEELATAAKKKGIIQADELKIKFIQHALEEDPSNWLAREIVIRNLAERGDIAGLASEVDKLDKLARVNDDDWNYCIKTAQLFAVSASVPWLQSEAYLNLNKSSQAFVEKTSIYIQAVRQIENLEQDLVAMLGSDPSLKKTPPPSLVSSAQIASADILAEKETINTARDFLKKLDSDEDFSKAVKNTLEGNVALTARSYADARARYKSALAIYPELAYAKKQSVETDFQEGISLIAAEETNYRGKRLLRGAYNSINELLAGDKMQNPQIPFVNPSRFTGEAWSLKAAIISAMRAAYAQDNSKIRSLEEEFKYALEQALKLNPNSLLAKQMLDRYSKDGF